MFKANHFMGLSLSDWVAHAPPELVVGHSGISEEVLKEIPRDKAAVMPR